MRIYVSILATEIRSVVRSAIRRLDSRRCNGERHFAITSLARITQKDSREVFPFSATARYFLSLARPTIVFVNAESAQCLAQVIKEDNANVRLVVFGDQSEFGDASLTSVLQSQDAAAIDKFECAKLSSHDQIATIVCSSGTSGFPKGTEISHAAMINYMTHVKVHDLKGHVSMWTPSMRWYCGLFIVIKAILDRSKRVIVPDYDDDDGLCHFIEKYEASGQLSSQIKEYLSANRALMPHPYNIASTRQRRINVRPSITRANNDDYALRGYNNYRAISTDPLE